MAWCWYVQGARGEGARRGPVLASARAGNINLRRKYIKRPDARVDVHAASHRVGVDESMYRTREQQQDLITSLRLGLRGLDAVDRGRDDLGHGTAVLRVVEAGVLDLLGDA